MQRAAEEVGIAAFDAICSAQKDRRLGASDLTLPYPTLPYLRKVRTRVQFGVVTGGNAVVTWGCVRGDTSRALSCRPLLALPLRLAAARVNDEQDEVARARYGDDLPATALALGGAGVVSGAVARLRATRAVVTPST